MVPGAVYKACSRCGKIHRADYTCNVNRVYRGGEERELRSSYAWAKKAQEIKEKASYLCEVCRDRGVYTYKGLEVHHIEKLTEAPKRLLDNSNLVCLCVEHHKEADKGKIKREYLENLARTREGE